MNQKDLMEHLKQMGCFDFLSILTPGATPQDLEREFQRQLEKDMQQKNMKDHSQETKQHKKKYTIFDVAKDLKSDQLARSLSNPKKIIRKLPDGSLFDQLNNNVLEFSHEVLNDTYEILRLIPVNYLQALDYYYHSGLVLFEHDDCLYILHDNSRLTTSDIFNVDWYIAHI